MLINKQVIITIFKLKISIICLISLASLIYIFSMPVITQDPLYHLFVDTRSFGAIPNTQDVLSNIFFVLVGILGVKEVLNKKNHQASSWIIFFLSIILVAPGSAYYHWSPNNFTLLWDRLPMSLGFMALFIILISEHINPKAEKYLTLGLLLGISSVIVWIITDDLRFYFWIQFSSFIIIPLVLLFFSSRYSHKYLYGISLFLYGLAKWSEVKDEAIFSLSHQFISGHTLKHLLAALGIAVLWWMVRIRKEISKL